MRKCKCHDDTIHGANCALFQSLRHTRTCLFLTYHEEFVVGDVQLCFPSTSFLRDTAGIIDIVAFQGTGGSRFSKS